MTLLSSLETKMKVGQKSVISSTAEAPFKIKILEKKTMPCQISIWRIKTQTSSGRPLVNVSNILLRKRESLYQEI